MARKSRWLETSNVRLPLELGSDRRETSATRVSDDLQISIFRRRKIFFRKNFQFFFRFSSFSVDFRGARVFLTSESSSSRFFALDGQIFRSVRPLELIFRFFTVRTSTCGGKCLWRLWKSVGLRFQGLEVVWLKNTFFSRFDFHFKPHDFHFKPCDFQFKPGNF